MHFGRIQLWFGGLFCVTASLLFTGCFGGHSATRGVPLSEAMAASASGNSANIATDESIRQASYYARDSRHSLTLVGEAEVAAEDRAAPIEEEYLLGFAAEEVLPLGSDIRSISRLELIPLAFQDEENYAAFYIGGGDVEFKSGSFLDQAITDSWMLDVGFLGRHYFTPPKTFLSPYFTGGIFGQILFWDYRVPVNVGGDIIHSDSVTGGGGFVGLGLAVARKEHLGIFVEARLGLSSYDEATMRGFYNDVFDAYGFASLRAGVNFRF